MAKRFVGLDIGTHAVRAAEIQVGRDGSTTLIKFGQVALPPGVVEGGEVADPGIVGDALKRLWKQAKFSTKKVALGVGNQRVVVRPAEMPAMEHDELRTAIEFQADELIPLPLAEVVLDYQVLETFVAEDDREMSRVLVVAAQRDMVQSLLAAVQSAGLKPTMIDIVPFALVRGAASPSALDALAEIPHEGNSDEDDSESSPFAVESDALDACGEAIVSIGAGVTTVVVHEFGIPRFIRILTQGGLSITEAIRDELDITLDEAEGLKRQVVDGHTDSDEQQAAFRAMSARLGSLLDEIQGSLEYHVAQSEAGPLERIVVTGGGSRIPGLEDRLNALLGVEVVRADPLATLKLGKTGLSPEQLEDAQDFLAVPVGLALAGLPSVAGYRRLSLVPPEVAQRRARARQVALVGVGAMGLVAFLGWVYLERVDEVAAAEASADAAERLVVQKQAEVTEHAAIRVLSTEVDISRALVLSALQYDVSWSKLIQEVSTVMPNDVWISNFLATAPSAQEPGQVEISGNGANHSSAARWILRIEPLESVTGQWLPVSQQSADELGLGIRDATFSSTVDLSDRVLSRRAERYLGIGNLLADLAAEVEAELNAGPQDEEVKP